MSQGVHLVPSSFSGYIVPDGKSQAPAMASPLSFSSNGGHHQLIRAANVLKYFPLYNPRSASVTSCKATNNNRRNPDFSRQRGTSRGKNRHYHERGEHSESLEDIDPLPSKNGSLLSISSSNSNQRYSATATPGRREKEIVELFRKVQAQLRARAAIKEEKKIEAASQGQGGGERGTVDSLLNLLRKHSVAQGKKSGREEEFNMDQQPERSSNMLEEPSSTFFSSSSISTSDEVIEPERDSYSAPLGRPTSNFRRRSPVPRVKFQPVFSAEEVGNSTSSLKSEGKKKVRGNESEVEVEDLEEPEADEESLEELSDSSDAEETKEDTLEASAAEISELSSLKLSELRAVAKSRGIKGYSKLKKAELVELLNADGS